MRFIICLFIFFLQLQVITYANPATPILPIDVYIGDMNCANKSPTKADLAQIFNPSNVNGAEFVFFTAQEALTLGNVALDQSVLGRDYISLGKAKQNGVTKVSDALKSAFTQHQFFSHIGITAYVKNKAIEALTPELVYSGTISTSTTGGKGAAILILKINGNKFLIVGSIHLDANSESTRTEQTDEIMRGIASVQTGIGSNDSNTVIIISGDSNIRLRQSDITSLLGDQNTIAALSHALSTPVARQRLYDANLTRLNHSQLVTRYRFIIPTPHSEVYLPTYKLSGGPAACSSPMTYEQIAACYFPRVPLAESTERLMRAKKHSPSFFDRISGSSSSGGSSPKSPSSPSSPISPGSSDAIDLGWLDAFFVNTGSGARISDIDQKGITSVTSSDHFPVTLRMKITFP